jgi:hypothetical protein
MFWYRDRYLFFYFLSSLPSLLATSSKHLSLLFTESQNYTCSLNCLIKFTIKLTQTIKGPAECHSLTRGQSTVRNTVVVPTILTKWNQIKCSVANFMDWNTFIQKWYEYLLMGKTSTGSKTKFYSLLQILTKFRLQIFKQHKILVGPEQLKCRAFGIPEW